MVRQIIDVYILYLFTLMRKITDKSISAVSKLGHLSVKL